MKRTIAIIIMMITVLGSSITAYAKPKEMEDGTTFDAEYYAQNNPDVVAALGNSESAMWNHYKQYGRTEGRKAYTDDNTTSASTPSATRSELAKSTKTKDNDEVAAGTKLVLPDGAVTTSGTTSSGVHWESSWYLHYTCAWSRIYDAYAGIPFVLEEIKGGEALSECFNKNLDVGGVEMYLDFGFYTDYVDQLKARGVIPQSYQLPKTYYTITSTGGKYSAGVYKMPYVSTDCPEAMAEYNRLVLGQSTSAPRSYTPKYLREQQQQ